MSERTIDIPEVLIDPRWTSTIAEIDGAKHLILSLTHPKHGQIHCLVTRDSTRWLHKWLGQALDQITGWSPSDA